MARKEGFYGVIVVLLAALVLSSSLAFFYYNRYEGQLSQTQKYTDELSSALASYRSLAAGNDAALSDYNTTLSLLAQAVANLNTSTPAYQKASAALSSLWNDYRSLASQAGGHALSYGVRMLMDFGNGTKVWHNETSVQPGWNAYVTTVVLLDGRVQATWYPSFGEHFVAGLEGVSSSPSSSWFLWDHATGGWAPSQTGADGMQIHNGTTFAWTLCGFDANYFPDCRP